MTVYLSYFIQILLIVHVLKTGRNRYWILLLLFIPVVGGIAYVIIELLPEFTASISGQKTMRGMKQVVDPGGELRRHAAAWDQSPNADNGRRYAAALLAAQKHAEAEEILGQAMTGLFSTEPNLMLLKAQARFESGDQPGAVAVLEALQEANPDFRSAKGHLMYACALETTGKTEQALDEFRSVANYYPGAEARYCLALALRNAGLHQESRAEFDQLIKDAALAPRHFRKSQARWIRLARKALAESE